MSRSLPVSILANIVLLAIVLRLATSRNAAPGTTANRKDTAKPNVVVRQGSPQAPLFRWSQLESSDYRIYIANLRGIGCPEQTIRDIIKADVSSLYAGRRAQAASDAERARLQTEEAATLAALLGEDARIESPPPRVFVKRIPGLAPRLPLVFQDADLSSLPLTPQQVKVILDLQQRFRQALAGTTQDPSDPIYRERWQSAQAANDSLLRGLLGEQFFLEYQVLLASQKPNL